MRSATTTLRTLNELQLILDAALFSLQKSSAQVLHVSSTSPVCILIQSYFPSLPRFTHFFSVIFFLVPPSSKMWVKHAASLPAGLDMHVSSSKLVQSASLQRLHFKARPERTKQAVILYSYLSFGLVWNFPDDFVICFSCLNRKSCKAIST